MPCRQAFSKTIIPQTYESVRGFVHKEIGQINTYSLTFDYWTSISSKSFLTITIHFLTQEFKLRDYVLKTIEIKEDHTGVNTAKVIKSVLQEYSLPNGSHHKIWAVTDGAANMKKTVKELQWPHILCFSHILHNCLTTNSWFKEGGISIFLEKCRDLIKFFRLSPKNSNALKQIQEKLKLPQIKLKLDVLTRWNSMYDMLERLVDNRVAIVNLALEKQEVNKLSLTNNEWQELIDVKETLSPFKAITDLLSSSKMPSISILKPIINNIEQNIYFR